MSKRLKLQLGGEAEMEERAFNNPHPDYPAHAAAAAAAAAPPAGAADVSPSGSEGKRCRPPSPEGDPALPFDGDGKVSEPGREAALAPSKAPAWNLGVLNVLERPPGASQPL